MLTRTTNHHGRVLASLNNNPGLTDVLQASLQPRISDGHMGWSLLYSRMLAYPGHQLINLGCLYAAARRNPSGVSPLPAGPVYDMRSRSKKRKHDETRSAGGAPEGAQAEGAQTEGAQTE